MSERVTHITEIIPKDMPDWAVEAFKNGQFFRVALERVAEAEKQAGEYKMAAAAEADEVDRRGKRIGTLKDDLDALIRRWEAWAADGTETAGLCAAELRALLEDDDATS